ncbi:MAG: hypothetical protein ACO3DD_10745, partial [Burkholderiaceae bacterium]
LDGLRRTLQGQSLSAREPKPAGQPLTASAVPKRLQSLARHRAWAVRRVQWGLDSLWRAMRLEGLGMPLARQIGIHCIDAVPMLRRWLIAQALGRATPLHF